MKTYKDILATSGKNKVIREGYRLLRTDKVCQCTNVYYQVNDFLGERRFPVLAIVESQVPWDSLHLFATGERLGCLWKNNTTYIFDCAIDLLKGSGMKRGQK